MDKSDLEKWSPLIEFTTVILSLIILLLTIIKRLNEL